MARTKKDKTFDQRMSEIERECFEMPEVYIDKIADCELKIDELNDRMSSLLVRIDDLDSITKRDLVIVNDLKNDVKSYHNRLEHLEKKSEYALHYTNETREQMRGIDAGVTTKIVSFIFIATAISWGVNIIIRFYI
jgi:chromosome segregation ATPase